jgi:MATE family multidrug resistance protein
VPGFSNLDVAVAADDEESTRGRLADERPLSPVSTRYRAGHGRHRRDSQATTRFADDSSGDEGGDVLRGLAATGGGAVFGSGRVGMGMTPSASPGGMEVDPAEELDAEDLELPMTDDGHEARQWAEALRVSRAGA